MIMSQVLEIEGVRVKQVKSITDARGTFVKFHPSNDLKNSLDSVALSFNPNLGTIRGLHFQVEPFAEEKLVSCVQGSIFDVIVDLRSDSKTFGKSASIELSAENAIQIYLPKGIAHGFQTLEADSIVYYGISGTYSPESAFSIDPFGDIGIRWPLQNFSISAKDSNGISLSRAISEYSEAISN